MTKPLIELVEEYGRLMRDHGEYPASGYGPEASDALVEIMKRLDAVERELVAVTDADDSLPDEDVHVLAFINGEWITAYHHNSFWMNASNWALPDATHWMPLPAVPAIDAAMARE